MARRIVADYPLVLTALALSLIGSAFVYSAGRTDVPTYVGGLYKPQIVWLLLGLGTAYAVSRTSVRLIQWLTIPAYALSVFLLALTLV
ncbi:MAG TPA: hypothetical protein VMY38_00910, partial [Gemmatimonadaceae bacterium]|nr:hypothetical protein [Gemmatimonadaceae bacterium]